MIKPSSSYQKMLWKDSFISAFADFLFFGLKIAILFAGLYVVTISLSSVLLRDLPQFCQLLDVPNGKNINTERGG